MSCRLTVEGRVLCVTFTDVIVAADLLQLGAAVRELEEKNHAPANRLVDLREAQGVDLAYSGVQSFAQSRNQQELNQDVRVAVVATTDLHFGIARIFQSLTRNPRIHLQIFRQYEPAWVWVTEEAEAAAPVS